MTYSLWLFKKWYEQHGLSLSSFISDTDCNIESIALYDSFPEEQAAHTAIVIPADNLDNCSGFRCALYYGQDRLLFPIASPETVFNLGKEMIESYHTRISELQSDIMQDVSISSLLIQTQSLFSFPMAICRKDGCVLYHSKDWTIHLSTDSIIQLKKKFQPSGYRDYPFFLPVNIQRTGTLIGYIPDAQKGDWALLASDTNNSLQPGDMHIFQQIAHVLSQALLYEGSQTASLHPMANWYASQLTAANDLTSSDPQSVSSDWDIGDYYMIACIQAEKMQSFATSALIRALTVQGYCCVPVSESISVLMHLGKDYPTDYSGSVNKLISCCRGFAVRIGFSLIFCELNYINKYYEQSMAAVTEAQEQNLSYFSIANALSKYLLQACKDTPEIQAYIHPEIKKLAREDYISSDDLLLTLYTYIILGRSVSKTSDVLFIHRNTLRNRLNKIRQIISLDPDDEKQLEHVLLSLIITPAK